jgi:nucleoside-diphosphate-sugar epimerase
MHRRVPDISKISALTGYTPKVPIDESLRLTCDWFRQQRAGDAQAHAANAAD